MDGWVVKLIRVHGKETQWYSMQVEASPHSISEYLNYDVIGSIERTLHIGGVIEIK